MRELRGCREKTFSWCGFIAALLVGASLTACGSDDDTQSVNETQSPNETQTLNETQTIVSTHPTGSVGGVVLDAASELPVPGGASVVVLSGAEQAQVTTTAADGTFYVDEVSASGNVLVMVEADNYLSAKVEGQLENAAGNYPVDNAALTLEPIGLLSNRGVLRLHVVDSNGAPAADIPISVTTAVRFVTYEQGSIVPHGQVVSTATTGADGRARLLGLPDYLRLGNLVDDSLLLSIPPADTDADGVVDAAGTTDVLNGAHVLGREQVIMLDNSLPAELEVISSNVAAVASGMRDDPTVLPVDATVLVSYSLPLDAAATTVRMVADTSGDEVDLDVSIDNGSVSIAFSESLAAGAKYHLQLHAVANVTGSVLTDDVYAPLYTVPDGPPQVVMITKDQDTGHILLDFDQPIGTGSFSHNSNFYNSRCVLWFDAQLEGGNPTGLDPAEYGHPSCLIGAAYTFESDEQLSALPGAYVSGYTTRWRFFPPNASGGTALSTGTLFSVHFSAVTEVNYLVTTPGGALVPDMIDLAIPN